VTITSSRQIQRHASDSSAQGKGEEAARICLEKRLKYPLPKEILKVAGRRVEVDGKNDQGKTLCEISCHIGSLKSGQRHKVAGDMLKLIFVGKALGGKWRKVLCLVDQEAAKSVNESWLGAAAKQMGIEVQVVLLPKAKRDDIEKAQVSQRR
jgi:hypothetical protein